MKFFIFFISLFFASPALATNINWYLLGKPVDHIFKQNIFYVVGGMALVPIVHELGHVVDAEIQGIALHYDGMGGFEIDREGLTDSQIIRQARSGPLANLIFGFGLKFSKWSNSDFANGYFQGQAFQLATYKLRRGDSGDFNLIDEHGGNGNFERNLYTSLALGQLWLTTDEYEEAVNDIVWPVVGLNVTL